MNQLNALGALVLGGCLIILGIFLLIMGGIFAVALWGVLAG